MDESLKKYLWGLNCSIVNPVKKSLYDNEIVAWYCKSTSVIKKPIHLKEIQKFIQENNLEYYISDTNETTSEFLIHKN